MHCVLVNVYWKCNFPMTRSVGRLVGLSVCMPINMQEVSLPCSYRSSCYFTFTMTKCSLFSIPFQNCNIMCLKVLLNGRSSRVTLNEAKPSTKPVFFITFNPRCTNITLKDTNGVDASTEQK